MRLLKNTMILAAVIAMAVSCHEPLRGEDNPQEENIGYLAFSDGLDVDVIVDHKHNNGGVETFDEGATPTVDINTFDCFIYDAEGNLVENGKFKYAARPTESNPLNLKAGNYTLKMLSGTMTDGSGNAVDAAWESPIYGLTKPFTINIKQTTNLSDLVCTLQNIQATIEYSEDLRAALSKDTVATLTVGNGSLDYKMTETRAGFFTAPEAKNTIDILIVGTYTAEGKAPATFEFTSSIEDVVAGQYRDIELYIKYSDDGNINISVSVDDWVIDDVVTFDLAAVIKEDVMVDDSDKPTVTLVGGDIDQTLLITADDFDSNNNCSKSVVVDVATKSAIKSLIVNVASDNYDMIESLATYHLTETFDLCAMDGTAATMLSLMGVPCNDKVLGQPTVQFDLTSLMSKLKEYAGTHSFKATVTDEQGGITEKTLTIKMDGQQADPNIIWVGHNINNRYTVTDDLTVDILVKASKGVKAFTVKIASDVLTPAELKKVGLCDVLDLVNPTQSYSTVDAGFDASNIKYVLSGNKEDSDPSNDNGLGFPTGDDVKDKAEVNFSITSFLSLLSLTGAGDHDFVMTVTDNDGNTITKTLMIKTVK